MGELGRDWSISYQVTYCGERGVRVETVALVFRAHTPRVTWSGQISGFVEQPQFRRNSYDFQQADRTPVRCWELRSHSCHSIICAHIHTRTHIHIHTHTHTRPVVPSISPYAGSGSVSVCLWYAAGFTYAVRG
jgi:hypothetical protein